MQVQGVLPYIGNNSVSFKSSIVTLSKANLGDSIKENVVDTFNRNILPDIQSTQEEDSLETIEMAGGQGRVIKTPDDYKNKVNFFALGAGSGSRFRELAQTVGDYNKISLPYKTENPDRDVHMLDFAMAMGKNFIDDKGVQTIVSSKASGSFGDIVKHYLDDENEIKDTVVCCGDNVFGDDSKKIMSFFTKAINDPNKHVALVGVERTPEEVAGRFGVLEVEKQENGDNYKLLGFSEKPPLDVAQKLAVNGKNIANTGLFYISKEAMTNLIDEIKNGENNIKKSDKEPYDFANAVKYVHSKTNDWFNLDSKEASEVMTVEKWEDVGEPKALYSFLDDVKKEGTYLQNFPKNFADEIQSSFKKRIKLDGKTPFINFSSNLNPDREQIKNAKSVEGVNILV